MNNKTKLIGKRVEQIRTGSVDIIMCIYLFIENSQTTKYKTEQKIQIAYINIITAYTYLCLSKHVPFKARPRPPSEA